MKLNYFNAAICLFLAGTTLLQAEENLALKASVQANSEFSSRYQAKFAADGIIPEDGGNNDLDHAWCVENKTAKDYGELTFTWNEPVGASQIVYWGRTSYFLSECWKDYKVFLDDSEKPVAEGTFQQKQGHQVIAFPKQSVRKIKLVFLNSYGGPNPGAAEVMIFAEPVAEKELKKLSRGASPASLADLEPESQNFFSADWISLS